LTKTPFFVNDKLRDWQCEGPRYAGVSSFGIGGTNAHVIVEEAPVLLLRSPSRPLQLLTLSAKTPTALQQSQMNLTHWLRQNPEAVLPDIAYTLNRGRHAFRHRTFWVGKALQEESLASYTAPEQPQEVLFLFPGQGSQYPQMTQALYQTEPVYRQALDHCSALMRPYLGGELPDILYQQSFDLKQTNRTQPILFAVEYALAPIVDKLGY
jgi:acyl transferase domain-containing protein